MDSSENTSERLSSEQEMVDITSLVEECAASLSVSDPFLCDPQSFNLHDAMAASQLMDKKMDSCEIPVSLIAPHGRMKDGEDEKMLFPRPIPTGLDDPFTPLPWEKLTMKDSAIICLEILVRLQSLLSGASVAESTFTCLYAHAAVLTDMKSRLFPDSLEGEFGDLMMDPIKKAAQLAVYAAALALVYITEVFRDTVLNADIYEEEDFVQNTYNIPMYTEQAEVNSFRILELALKSTTSAKEKHPVEGDVILLVLGIEFGFLSVCHKLAQISAAELHHIAEAMQSISTSVQSKLDFMHPFLDKMPPHDSVEVQSLIRQTFDPFVNRPFLGNTPVRRVSFRTPKESVPVLCTISAEFNWAVCNLLLRGSSLGRIQRMLDRVTRSDVNILSRSLIVLNLYFEERILGQYPLRQMIIDHMRQMMHVPPTFLKNEHSQIFLNRLAKPVYDNLKLRVLNPNRQRAYIEAVLLQDWTSLQNEAHLVDVHYRQVNNLDNSTPPYFSQYVLTTLIRLMDRHVSSGIELGIFYGHHDLSFAYWYRDFLLSALLSNLSMMRRAKDLQRPSKRPTETKGRGKKKSHKKNGSSTEEKTPEDLEDEFELVVVGLKRMLCRGLLRFIAALQQAGILKAKHYEFTSLEKIFEKRFELFQSVQQPPPLSYSDYLEGSSFSRVPQNELVESTAEWFQSCKATVDRLLASISTLDPDYTPMQEDEIRSLLKVCVGNSVYVRRLQQLIETTPDKPVKVDFDYSANKEFCTIKLS